MYSLGPGACSAQARGETTRYPLRSCSPQPAVRIQQTRRYARYIVYRLYFGSRTVFFSSKIYISIDWLGGASKKLSGLLARCGSSIAEQNGLPRVASRAAAVNAGRQFNADGGSFENHKRHGRRNLCEPAGPQNDTPCDFMAKATKFHHTPPTSRPPPAKPIRLGRERR